MHRSALALVLRGFEGVLMREVDLVGLAASSLLATVAYIGHAVIWRRWVEGTIFRTYEESIEIKLDTARLRALRTHSEVLHGKLVEIGNVRSVLHKSASRRPTRKQVDEARALSDRLEDLTNERFVVRLPANPPLPAPRRIDVDRLRKARNTGQSRASN